MAGAAAPVPFASPDARLRFARKVSEPGSSSTALANCSAACRKSRRLTNTMPRSL